METKPECGRSDCQKPAETIAIWRSQSDREWQVKACGEHWSFEPPMPGFVPVRTLQVIHA